MRRVACQPSYGLRDVLRGAGRIAVSCKSNSYVTVQEAGTGTQHRVTLRQTDYERLFGSMAGPEALVKESFHFYWSANRRSRSCAPLS